MGALERLEATDLACWGHLHGRCPAPAQHSVAHGLPPPRQHERMNVEGRGHRLHLHPPLTTQPRSEEHTSELQSQSNLVCRLLLEKKKNEKIQPILAQLEKLLLCDLSPSTNDSVNN